MSTFNIYQYISTFYTDIFWINRNLTQMQECMFIFLHVLLLHYKTTFHWKGLSPVCIFLWLAREVFFSNCFFASISTIRHFSSVDHHMSTKICFKSKMFITHMILIRHFSRVHSQMIYRTFLGAFIGFSPVCIPICTTRTLLIIN